MTSIEFQQIVNQPFLYANGCVMTNDATTPHSILDISAGQFRDSTNSVDINLGNFLGDYDDLTANTVTLLSTLVNGINGLDTGAVAASSLYYVYLIGDPSNFRPSGVIASLAAPAVGPLMPFGYGVQRWIGCFATDSSKNILLQYNSGGNNSRLCMYDAPQASPITAGASTSYANVNLINLVPNLAINQPVWIYSVYTPNAASNTLKLQPGNATGDAITITAQVAHVIVTSNSLVMSQQVSVTSVLSPVVNYKVSSGSDAVAVDVAGYQIYV